MRKLDIEELEELFNRDINSLRFGTFNEVRTMLDQLLGLLDSQPIGINILGRIEKDFNDLKYELESGESFEPRSAFRKKVLGLLDTREKQGAFGYFMIRKTFQKSRRFGEDYIELAANWRYTNDFRYDEYFDKFCTFFLVPFQELFLWYIKESKPKSPDDYYSYQEQSLVLSKLEEINKKLFELGLGQQVLDIHNEEFENSMKYLNKRSFIAQVFGTVTKSIFETVPGDELKDKIERLREILERSFN